MVIYNNIAPLRTALNAFGQAGQSVGFVPTMGALHAGHAALVRQARQENHRVVVSIFVNPTQFGPTEDLAKYPRTLDADVALLQELGVDAVFAPEPATMYMPNEQVHVTLPALALLYEGKTRPGHFDGVALVVSKLLNLVQPTRAYFGRKDYQQTVVVRQLVQALFFNTQVVVADTVREPDGLAMSSRNRYLNATERLQAPLIYQGLLAMRAAAVAGQQVQVLQNIFADMLLKGPDFKLDYVAIADGESLEPLSQLEPDRNPVALVAAWLGSTRLIDNLGLH